MPNRRTISRRDFLNGMALSSVAGTFLSPLEAFGYSAGNESPYPPALTGMRGSHAGSFEVAHDLITGNGKWNRPERQTDDTYDLIVVGGGISGLSAAWLYRKQAGPGSRILILDNHDDFGGHAKRNEFDVDGEKLIGYGGSMTIEGPSSYSREAAQLLKDLSIEVERFYGYFDQDFYDRWKLENAIYFHREAYGTDRLVADPFGNKYYASSKATLDDILSDFPVDNETRAALLRLLTDDTDYLAPLSDKEKIETLRHISYVEYLGKYVDIPKQGRDILRDELKGIWALGWDALSALEGIRLGMPGTANLGLTDEQIGNDYSDEPYIFHFPDGNAGIARALVRSLIPGAVPGRTMEDLVTARADYAQLDRPDSAVRVRLNSTVVDVRHAHNGNEAEVVYVKDGLAGRVCAKHVILACYNGMIPYICPEVPDKQRQAIEYAAKVPLVYINIALRNWRAFADLGCHYIYIPKAPLMHSMTLDFPVSMGDYKFSADPDKPIVIHATYCPTTPDQGLSARQQFILGKRKLMELRFADFEDDVFRQMDGALSGGGFDAERDIAAITVNRWPHGYAYEYNELWDPDDWGRNNGPHIAGRAQIGRISIANSDASAYAYANGAIDAAVRAVEEQLALT